MKKYKLTKEHEALLAPWRDRWIANSFSCAPMDAGEREKIKDSIEGLYRAAGLLPPPRQRIVIVPSPFVLRFAAGFAAAVWHRRAGGGSTNAATEAATYAATRAATRDATEAATYAATRDATYAATKAATRAATEAATYAATSDATEAATRDDEWYIFSRKMPQLAKKIGVGKLGLSCATEIFATWNGGNQWSGWAAFLSFFRHVGLGLDYSKWQHYEALAEAGPRIVQEKFAMVSERPCELRVNGKNQPHCETGPYCRWRDGSALYALNGVRMPRWAVETPAEGITPRQVLGEENADVRRELIRKVGIERMLNALPHSLLDSQATYELYSVNLGQGAKSAKYLKMTNPSVGCFHLEGVAPECDTVDSALRWRNSQWFAEAEMLT